VVSKVCRPKSPRENNKWELKLILNKALKRPRHRGPSGHSAAPQLCKRLHFLRWQTNFHKSCSINFERQQCKATTSYFAPQLWCRRRRSVCFATRVYHCGLNVSLAQGNLPFGAHLMWRHFVKLLAPEFLWIKELNSSLCVCCLCADKVISNEFLLINVPKFWSSLLRPELIHFHFRREIK
jgi:hypothetical protein